jgi:hypothetical protein
MSHESLQHEQQSIFLPSLDRVGLCAKATLATAIVNPSTQTIFLKVFTMISPIEKE